METLDWRDLPPITKPEEKRTQQSRMGCLMIIGITLSLVATTHGFALTFGSFPTHGWWTILVLIYTEAAVAFYCLWGLLYADPGVIVRSAQTCLPFPPEIAKALRQGHPLPDTNIINDVEGATYCVNWPVICQTSAAQPMQHRLFLFLVESDLAVLIGALSCMEKSPNAPSAPAPPVVLRFLAVWPDAARRQERCTRGVFPPLQHMPALCERV